MRILVVDDEAPARRKLMRLLAEEPDAEMVGEAADGVAAVREIRRLEPDVVLLDVRMPGLDGFDVVEEIGIEAMPLVVFVTAFDEHAIRAFEVRALDYVLKPVDPDRFHEVMARVRERLGPGDLDAARRRLTDVIDDLGVRRRPLQRLLVHEDERAFLIPIEDVDRFRSDRNYVRVHTTDAEYRIRSTMTALEERLDPDAFLRINRSEIVRLDAIDRMEPWFHGDYHVVLSDGTRTTWSRRYRARQRDRFEIG